MNISMIGFGNMAKAIARGLLCDPSNQLHVAAPSLSIGINKQGIRTHYDNLSVIVDADILILAVKPTQMAAVLTQISPTLPAHCLIISIAAGLKLTWLGARLNPGMALVRAMPNIAAAVGESATPLCANAVVTDAQKKIAQQIFARIGITTWVQQECDIDAFTALSGSGPAYVFLFMDAMINAAMKLGLEANIAKLFALQTVKGAVDLAQAQTLSLTTLRETVTSPKGTTAAAIQVLVEHDLEHLIFTAMSAALARARELGTLEER